LGRSKGTALKKLTAQFRNLPVPIIGRIQNNALLLDLRCLEKVSAFKKQLQILSLSL